MKFLIAFALFAVASASVIPPAVIASENPEIQEIVAAIQSPSTDPATAAALEQLLLQVLGLAEPEPIAVGPALVDNEEPISIGPALVDNEEPISIGPVIVDNYEPISIGPALIDFPLPPTPVKPTPVGPPAKAPLVQIILNIQSSSDVAVESNPTPEPVIIDRPIVPNPEVVEEKPIIPTPVIVVENPEAPESVIVVDKPVVPEPIVPEPVIVVEQPSIPEAVIVAQPIIPAPAIVLPDILN
ncbi:unnamed protein product, partial [Iphiclides podalirius]